MTSQCIMGRNQEKHGGEIPMKKIRQKWCWWGTNCGLWTRIRVEHVGPNTCPPSSSNLFFFDQKSIR